MRLRALHAVLVVLDRDRGERLLRGTIGREVAVRGEREDVRRPLAEVEHRVAPVGAREATVAHLLEADGEHDVVLPGGDREAGVAEGVHARGAVVLHTRHGAAEELERVGECVAAEGGHDGAHPRRLDALPLAARIRERLVDRVAEEVLGTLVVELAERRAADAHDGDAGAQVERHARGYRRAGGRGSTAGGACLDPRRGGPTTLAPSPAPAATAPALPRPLEEGV